MSNGIRKNWKVVREELSEWRALMPIHIREYKDARGTRKAHKAWNLVTESIRLLPRTTGYALFVAIILDALLHIWLWVR